MVRLTALRVSTMITATRTVKGFFTQNFDIVLFDSLQNVGVWVALQLLHNLPDLLQQLLLQALHLADLLRGEPAHQLRQ